MSLVDENLYAKTAWSVQPFRQNTGVWQTDKLAHNDSIIYSASIYCSIRPSDVLTDCINTANKVETYIMHSTVRVHVIVDRSKYNITLYMYQTSII